MQLNTFSWGREDAPVIVCLHGVTGHGLRFRKLAEERLVDRFRVLSLDLRGHGESTWDPPWDIDTHVADVLETVAAHGVEPAAWLGHSFGGRLVAEIAQREPDRVQRSILLDPALWVPPETSLAQAEGLRPDTSFANAEEAKAAKLATGTYLSTPPEILDEEAEQHLVLGADGRLRWRFSPLAVITAWSEMSTDPPPIPLRAILVVLGAQSWIPVRLPEVATIQVVTVPGGHSVLWDDFDATADAIDLFLAAG